MAGPNRGRSLARPTPGPSKGRRRAPESMKHAHRPISRDEEIRERVKIPVDEGLGGCRGFKSHRPHHVALGCLEFVLFFDNAVCETAKNHSRLEAIGKLLELYCNLFQLSFYSRRVPVFRDFHRKGIQLGSQSCQRVFLVCPNHSPKTSLAHPRVEKRVIFMISRSFAVPAVRMVRVGRLRQ